MGMDEKVICRDCQYCVPYGPCERQHAIRGQCLCPVPWVGAMTVEMPFDGISLDERHPCRTFKPRKKG